MGTIYVTEQTAPEVVEVAKRAFPEYTGKTFQIRPFQGPKRLDSAWSGGSKSTYRFVRLSAASNGSFEVPENGGHPLQNHGEICMLSELPEGLALVEHVLFCGRDLGLRVFVNPNNMNKLALPAATTVTHAQLLVLTIVRSFISCVRKEEAARKGIDLELWTKTVEELKGMKLLAKNGGITPEGRNVVGDRQLHYLEPYKKEV